MVIGIQPTEDMKLEGLCVVDNSTKTKSAALLIDACDRRLDSSDTANWNQL